jgi:hypothetical protein
MSRPVVVLCVLTVVAAVVQSGISPASSTRRQALRLESVRVAGARERVTMVARFSGGNVPTGVVEASDANPFDGRATVAVLGARISSAVAAAQGSGMRVRIAVRSGRLTLAFASPARAFTYVGYRREGRGVLAFVLWRAGPPAAGAHPHFGPAGCLTLRASLRGSIIRAAGDEAGLFEHSFLLRLRTRGGALVGQRVITAAGHWAAALPFSARAGRVATLEAYAASAKDGSLACLVQQRITR